MNFTVTIGPDGKTVLEFDAGQSTVADDIAEDELRGHLSATGIGTELEPSLRGISGIARRVLHNGRVGDDTKQILVLIFQLVRYASIVDLVVGPNPVIDSEFRRTIVAMQRILSGDAPTGKRGVWVPSGLFQREVIEVIEARQEAFVTASPDEQARLVAAVAAEIRLLVGIEPTLDAIRNALAVAGRRQGRLPGSRTRGKAVASKSDVYNALLRQLGLDANSGEALGKQRGRGKGQRTASGPNHSRKKVGR